MLSKADVNSRTAFIDMRIQWDRVANSKVGAKAEFPYVVGAMRVEAFRQKTTRRRVIALVPDRASVLHPICYGMIVKARVPLRNRIHVECKIRYEYSVEGRGKRGFSSGWQAAAAPGSDA